MKTAILEILTAGASDEMFADFAHPDNIRWNQMASIHQLLCDSMATAMYRCMEHLTAKKQLAKSRLAEYGFSKEEIELSISKLEKE